MSGHKSKILPRIVLVLLIINLWFLFLAIYDLIPSVNLTKVILQLPFTSSNLYEPFYNFFKQNYYAYFFTLYILYLFLYIFWLLIPFYFLCKKDLKTYDKLVLSGIMLLFLAMLTYSIFYVEPPRFCYNLNLYPYDDFSKKFREDVFALPSMHVAVPALIYLVLRKTKYKKLSLLALLYTIIISIVVIVLVLHWIYDIFAGIIYAIISVRLFKEVYPYYLRFINALQDNLTKEHLIYLIIMLSTLSILFLIIN